MAKLAKRYGYRLSRVNHHIRLRHRHTNRLVICPKTPSCWRSMKNLEAELKKAP